MQQVAHDRTHRYIPTWMRLMQVRPALAGSCRMPGGETPVLNGKTAGDHMLKRNRSCHAHEVVKHGRLRSNHYYSQLSNACSHREQRSQSLLSAFMLFGMRTGLESGLITRQP